MNVICEASSDPVFDKVEQRLRYIAHIWHIALKALLLSNARNSTNAIAFDQEFGLGDAEEENEDNDGDVTNTSNDGETLVKNLEILIRRVHHNRRLRDRFLQLKLHEGPGSIVKSHKEWDKVGQAVPRMPKLGSKIY